MPVDENELNDLIGRFITDLGATVHAGNVVIGDRLGNQAGEAAVHLIATAAGFTRVRRATETPFNIIYEVRP